MLVDLNLKEFSDELKSSSPAPGGGSVAALSAALSASLAKMVTGLTIGNRCSENYSEDMIKRLEKAGDMAEKAIPEFLSLIDQDTKGFLNFMDALKMPKNTDGEKALRKAALDKAKADILAVPRTVANKALTIYEAVETVVEIGNPSALSDAGVSSLMLDAAVKGAVYNVKINLPMVKDEEFKKTVFEEAENLLTISSEKANAIYAIVNSRLNEGI